MDVASTATFVDRLKIVPWLSGVQQIASASKL
jgi:hypothetical protein